MPEITAAHNQFAYSVSEISGALKRVVEDNFGQVRVRGEISGWKLAASGHGYLKLKDEGAVLDAVCWRGTLGKMAFKPEDGMEVICSGRITTYPGRSNYQIVIDFMEPAGLGALMALLDKRRKQLASEGLFDEKRKKPLPFMPSVIGVVTSPTGAVIRDILHRISERFPCHVLVWPVLVQGEGAAEQVARAIEGFNRFTGETLPRPDLLIVARGGGSLEDLWAFNEEIVVRAAAASLIPLISAVGHETDTTLIDHASDRRAPTPTAAAEIAVPVRQEWLFTLIDLHKRHGAAALRGLTARTDKLSGLMRGLIHPKRSLDTATQKLDDWSERLLVSLPGLMAQKSQQLAVAGARLQPKHLAQGLHRQEDDVRSLGERTLACMTSLLALKRQNLAVSAAKLQPARLAQTLARQGSEVDALGERAQRLAKRVMEDRARMLANLTQLLESLDYKRVLQRGFALVRDARGVIVSRAEAMTDAPHTLIFYDGEKRVEPVDG